MGDTRGLLRGHEGLVGAMQRLADTAWIILAHYLAFVAHNDVWRPAMTTATAIAVVLYGLAAEVNGIYRAWRSERLIVEIRAVFTTWLVVPPTLFLIAFATKTTADHSRMVSLGWFGLALALLIGWRLATRFVLRSLRAHGRNTRRVAIWGATKSAETLCDSIANRPWLGMNVTGIYDIRAERRRHRFEKHDIPFAGGIDELVRDAQAGNVDIVYVALPLRAEARIGHVLRALADTTATVYLMADFFMYDLLHARWSQVGEMPVVSIYDSPFHGAGGGVKRIEDLVLGSFILAIVALPLMVIAALVKLTSPGPVFFRQRRYGLNGKEIRVLKFRTMSVAEDGDDVKQAVENDPRVTPIGRILRRTSLDELPQFLQVITGEMSIVGPRPHAVAHNEEYRALIQGYMLRHKVKPGITGWAQVNGWRGETDSLDKMKGRIEHDLEYIQNWNLLLDLKIIGLTIFGSKKNQNAY